MDPTTTTPELARAERPCYGAAGELPGDAATLYEWIRAGSLPPGTAPFEIVGAPSQALNREIRRGDVLLHRMLGEGTLAETYLVTDVADGSVETMLLDGGGFGKQRSLAPADHMGIVAPEYAIVRPAPAPSPGRAEAVDPNTYRLIRDALTYGLTDWAITDAEAERVIGLLDAMGDDELLDTYFQMLVDGLWDRLVANVPYGGKHIGFRNVSRRIARLTDQGATPESRNALVRDICEFFFPGNPPVCINDEVTEVAVEMIRRAVHQCPVMMDLVPRPFLGLSRGRLLTWLLRKGASQFLAAVRRQGRTYEICRTAVAGGFRRVYEVAQIGCG
jgi:hypothetical protein